MTTDLKTYSILPATADAYEAERIPSADVTLLPAADGRRWAKVKRDGRILQLGHTRLAAETTNPWRPGQVAIVERHRIEDRSMGLIGGGHRTHLVEQITEATLATEADYQRAQQADATRAQRAKRAANPTPRPVDALSDNPVLRGKPAAYLAVAPVSADPIHRVMSAATRGLIEVKGRDAIAGPAAIVALLAKRGIELRLSEDGSWMYAVAKRGISQDLRDLIRDAGPLLHAHLQGDPLPCVLPGHKDVPLATTLAVGAAPMCQAHADGAVTLD